MSTVQEIANQYLGAPNAQPTPNEAAAVQAAEQAAAQQKAAEVTAEQVKAQDAVQAATPTDAEDTTAYTIDFDGEKRTLTPQQIKATFERYRSLNGKHSNMKPVLALAEKLMEGTGANAEQVATAMMEALKKANTKNPTMGAKAEEANEQGDPDEAALEAWERDNAASLPPGYKNMAKSNKAIMAELKNTQKMLMGILQASSQVAQAAAQQGKRVQQTAITQAKQQMAINLSKAQQAHGLPDDSAQDFMTFAAERGYTLEDFVNPELAYSVVGDFKNARNSPEMERLRAIAQKRQAFTASVGSAPGGQQAGAAPAQTSFDSLANSVLARRQQFNQ
jgi:hypothetical protein